VGHVSQFDLGQIIATYGTTVFLETGTYQGSSLRHAAQFGFHRLISIEADPDLAARVAGDFRDDPRVAIHVGDSLQWLPKVLDALSDVYSLCCWLDAHYPAGPAVTELPLLQELGLLAAYPGFRASVILIDDRRIYENDAYTSGGLPGGYAQGDGRALIDFEDRIAPSHVVERSTIGEGTIAFYPRHA